MGDSIGNPWTASSMRPGLFFFFFCMLCSLMNSQYPKEYLALSKGLGNICRMGGSINKPMNEAVNNCKSSSLQAGCVFSYVL